MNIVNIIFVGKVAVLAFNFKSTKYFASTSVKWLIVPEIALKPESGWADG